MITTVLVPTDFSDEAHKALRYAAALVRRVGAQLHVVNVNEIDFAIPGPESPGGHPWLPNIEETKALKQQVEAVVGADVVLNYHARVGRSFNQIVRCASEISADLIVMSTHGRSGLKHFFLGSTTERVVQYSLSPVLVVRRGEGEALSQGQPLSIESILVPTDFSASSAEGVRYAINFARSFSARLVVFHSLEAPQFITIDSSGRHTLPPTPEAARATVENQMQQFVQEFEFDGVQFETQIRMGRPAEAICNYALEKKNDLIITSTHGRTGFMHVLIGSVAERVVRYASVPVLVVPASMTKVGTGKAAGGNDR